MIKHIIHIHNPPKIIDHIIYQGIRHLKEMDVVIKQADKNLGIVPIRGDFYAAMVRKWLVMPAFQKVSHFPHIDLCRRIENTIRYTKAIPEQQKQSWSSHIHAAQNACPFYIIPKIHKHIPLASRPISAQHSYIMAPLSKDLTKVLLTEQYKFKTIMTDTIQFINQIENLCIQEEFVLVTYDVEACYPNIDINDAIDTLYKNIKSLQMNNSFWTKVLQLIMYNNYVSSNDTIYRQLTGTATGTQVAPPFANLYLYYKFKDILDNQNILYESRFIDDGFLLVKTKEKAISILKQLNDATNLNLTYEIDSVRAVFLDLIIYKGLRFKQEHILDLQTFFKPTNRMLYLPMKSNHPISMKRGIIIGECIRTLRNSSNKSNWIQALRTIFKGLMSRGYPPSFIQNTWKQIRWEHREFYLTCRSSKPAPTGKLVFTRFNPKTIQTWKKLQLQHPFENIFPQKMYRWNQRQLSIIKDWPPKVVWCDFRKITHKTISSKQGWSYRKRSRGEEDNEKQIKKRKTYHVAQSGKKNKGEA